ncbi:MAG: UDP-3-O-(3-hydroxymyristoyl)glucosamine N-acyltransferase, partial [Psychrosphaera sp.]|nr:UDP-3-O-(3-hydroxymyristoyl)glucosamine N-acyltransferase [Psychrosphaera sp.]
ATLANAGEGCISFLSNKKYRSQLVDTKATAVLLHPNELEYCQQNSDINAIVLDNPYLGYALLAQMMDTTPRQAPGIASSAVISQDASVAVSASIGANAVIEAGVVIEDNVVIGPGCYIGLSSKVGRNTRLWANISIYHNVVIGRDCLFQAGVVIGSDGFGYAPKGKQWVKIPQLGGVTIGDRVEVGANTCIDRGALDDTIIKNGVIIDNQCQIAHNVIIGENSAMAGSCAVGGSTTIGANCAIGGKVGIIGHLNICDNVLITAMSLVTKDIQEPGGYSSGMSSIPSRQWRKSNARIRQLDDMYHKLRKHEKAIKYLSDMQNNTQ